MTVSNLFANIPEELPEELMEELVAGAGFRVERIVSRGHASPEGFWYDQDRHEWVVLLQGKAELALQDPNETLTLRPGDYLLIPAHRRHRVVWTAPDQDTVWLAIHFE